MCPDGVDTNLYKNAGMSEDEGHGLASLDEVAQMLLPVLTATPTLAVTQMVIELGVRPATP